MAAPGEPHRGDEPPAGNDGDPAARGGDANMKQSPTLAATGHDGHVQASTGSTAGDGDDPLPTVTSNVTAPDASARLAQLEQRVDELEAWREQLTTLLALYSGAIESVIESGDGMR